MHKPSLHRFRALILHGTSIREKDRVIEAYTREEGRMHFFAPGIHHVASRRAGHLEPFMESQIVAASSMKGYFIREAKVLRTFPRLRADIERVNYAYEIAKLLRGYTGENQKDMVLYDSILSLIANLDSPQKIPNFMKEAAEINILRSLGILPDLYRCTNCRAKLQADEFSFKKSHHGFWCSKCAGQGDPILTEVVKVFRFILDRNNRSIYMLRVSPQTLLRMREVVKGLFQAQPELARNFAGRYQ